MKMVHEFLILHKEAKLNVGINPSLACQMSGLPPAVDACLRLHVKVLLSTHAFIIHAHIAHHKFNQERVICFRLRDSVMVDWPS